MHRYEQDDNQCDRRNTHPHYLPLKAILNGVKQKFLCFTMSRAVNGHKATDTEKKPDYKRRKIKISVPTSHPLFGVH